MKEIYYFSMFDRPKKFSGVTKEYWEEIPQEILLVMKWSIDYFGDPVYMLFIEQRSARKNSNMVGSVRYVSNIMFVNTSLSLADCSHINSYRFSKHILNDLCTKLTNLIPIESESFTTNR